MLTGVYQYLAMSLAKTYTAIAKVNALPVLQGVAEVVMFFNIAAFGLALAWLATVGHRDAGRPTHLGCRSGGRVADPDLPDLHQFDAPGNGFATGGCWRGRADDLDWPAS